MLLDFHTDSLILKRWQTVSREEPTEIISRLPRAATANPEQKAQEVLDPILASLKSLVHRQDTASFSIKQKADLLKSCEKLLKRTRLVEHRVPAFLYHLAQMYLAMDSGREEDGIWYGRLAASKYEDVADVSKADILGHILMMQARLGRLANAESLSTHLRVEWGQSSLQHGLAFSSLYRLSNQEELFRSHLHHMKGAYPDHQAAIEWEAAFFQAKQQRSLSCIPLTAKAGDGRTPESLLMNNLLAFCLKQRRWLDAAHVNIKRCPQAELSHSRWKHLLKSISCISQMYDTDRCLQKRRENLLAMLSERHLLPTLEAEALVLLAAHRALRRASQHELADQPLQAYYEIVRRVRSHSHQIEDALV